MNIRYRYVSVFGTSFTVPVFTIQVTFVNEKLSFVIRQTYLPFPVYSSFCLLLFGWLPIYLSLFSCQLLRLWTVCPCYIEKSLEGSNPRWHLCEDVSDVNTECWNRTFNFSAYPLSWVLVTFLPSQLSLFRFICRVFCGAFFSFAVNFCLLLLFCIQVFPITRILWAI